MKFGGTSMGSAERIKVAARLTTERHAQRPVIVVVSAMSKITDLLLDAMRKAEAGDETGLNAALQPLRDRHSACCRELVPADSQAATLAGIDALVEEFGRIARGMLMLG